MAKTVDKSLSKNYLRKAEELLDVARFALETSKNNAAVTASIHSAINALDSVAVFYSGKRHAGSHEGALDAVKGSMTKAECAEVAKQFAGLIALKNQVEYQSDLMRPQDASDPVKRASRIVSKAKQKHSPT